MNVEFTNLPDLDRDRRHMRQQISAQLRGTRILMAVLTVVLLLGGLVALAIDASALSMCVIAVSAAYLSTMPRLA